jgi:hypothetical protein
MSEVVVDEHDETGPLYETSYVPGGKRTAYVTAPVVPRSTPRLAVPPLPLNWI